MIFIKNGVIFPLKKYSVYFLYKNIKKSLKKYIGWKEHCSKSPTAKEIMQLCYANAVKEVLQKPIYKIQNFRDEGSWLAGVCKSKD